MASIGSDKTSGILRGTYRVQMYYEDTDFSGYVYHANYLKFFERAREYVFGATYLKELYAENFHFVVATAEMAFKRPASFSDVIEVRSEAPFSSSPIIDFTQDAYLVGSPVDLPLVKAKIRLVAVDGNGKPVRIPDHVFSHLSSISERQL
jgi:acyl-CoA thioester hydrolase